MKKHYFLIGSLLVFVWFALSVFSLAFTLRFWTESQISSRLIAQVSSFGDKSESAFGVLREGDEITLLFVGDIMLDRGVGAQIRKNNDSAFPFRLVAEKIKEADLAFANLESPISSRGKNQGSIYSFRASPETAVGLAFAGFDILSLANNHIWDWGKEALEDTIDILIERGIKSVGAGRNYEEANQPVIQVVKNTKIAFLAYTDLYPTGLQAKENYPGVSRFDLSFISSKIRELQNEVDLIVVSMHWGEEYESRANDSQKFISHQLVEAGADLIIGHHPHVIQEIEHYRGAIIAYSLGNFVFDQNFSEETMSGLALKITIKDRRVFEILPIQVKILPTFQPYFVLE